MNDPQLLERLTERELEIALLVGLGHSVQKIAEELDCAPRTVYQHINNAARKIRGTAKPYLRVHMWARNRQADASRQTA